MEEVALSLRALLSRLGGFFDLLDLSFFVAGSITLGALGFSYRLLDGKSLMGVPESLLIPGGLVLSYMIGLFCFSVGRTLRRVVMYLLTRRSHAQRFAAELGELVAMHQLKVVPNPELKPPPIPAHYFDARHAGALYTLFWTRVRQSGHLAPSLSLLNRYWVLAATCDGLAIAAMVWAAVFFAWWRGVGMPQPGGGWTLGLGISALCFVPMCLRESQRYTRVQMDELVATVAWDQIERPPGPQPPSVLQLSVGGSGSPGPGGL